MEPMRHEEASQLLPWLGTNRLAADELEPLLDHLKICPDCRGELRHLSELGRFAELAERGEAPDAAAIERRLAAVMTRLEPTPAGRSGASLALGPRRAGAIGTWRAPWALAAALALVAAGLVFWGRPNPATPSPGLYQTLSSEAPIPARGEKLRVVFADSCSLGELRGLLLAAGAEIAAGPSRRGVYTLSLPASGPAETASSEARIAAWRGEACFELVEKVHGESGS